MQCRNMLNRKMFQMFFISNTFHMYIIYIYIYIYIYICAQDKSVIILWEEGDAK